MQRDLSIVITLSRQKTRKDKTQYSCYQCFIFGLGGGYTEDFTFWKFNELIHLCFVHFYKCILYWVVQNFIWVFLLDVMEKSERTFWTTQYFNLKLATKGEKKNTIDAKIKSIIFHVQFSSFEFIFSE